MKTLGLIGGTTWLSTIDYYRVINETVNSRLGGVHSAKLLLYSVDFEEFHSPSSPSDWARISDAFSEIARRLERAGAEALVLCANTAHVFAEAVQASVKIPLLHIVDAVADDITRQGVSSVALLGTQFTMEHAFFKDRLSRRGITTLVPEPSDRERIHSSISAELARGVCTAETKAFFLNVIAKLVAQGANGVILGCTEIPLLIKQADCPVPAFDTTMLHATAAADFALRM
jgi:aspartate racemase